MCFSASQLSSDVAYKREYESSVKGKLSAKPIESHPEYQHAMKVSKNLSKVGVSVLQHQDFRLIA